MHVRIIFAARCALTLITPHSRDSRLGATEDARGRGTNAMRFRAILFLIADDDNISQAQACRLINRYISIGISLERISVWRKSWGRKQQYFSSHIRVPRKRAAIVVPTILESFPYRGTISPLKFVNRCENSLCPVYRSSAPNSWFRIVSTRMWKLIVGFGIFHRLYKLDDFQFNF